MQTHDHSPTPAEVDQVVGRSSGRRKFFEIFVADSPVVVLLPALMVSYLTQGWHSNILASSTGPKYVR